MSYKFWRKGSLMLLAILLFLSGTMLSYVPSVQAETDGEYEYFFVDGGSAVRLSSYNGNDQIVDIPAQLGGLDVVEISDSAFQYNQLSTMTIPDTVIEQASHTFIRTLQAACFAIKKFLQ